MRDRLRRSEVIVSVVAVLVVIVVMAIALTVTPPRLDAPPMPIWGTVKSCETPAKDSAPHMTLLHPC